MYDLQNHQLICQSQKCKYFPICQNYVNKLKSYETIFCSRQCFIFDILKKYNKNSKQLYLELNDIVQQQRLVQKQLIWSQKYSFHQAKIKGNMFTIPSGIAYTFVTIVAQPAFYSGKHYWEIILTPQTVNQSKCGVTTTLQIDYSKAFSDYITGFAFYGLGQLRNGSDSTGKKYGKPWSKNQTLGVFLDMQNGTLSYMINNYNYGIAFQDPKLKKGPIYAAMSILKIGGSIIYTKPIPKVYLQ